MAVNAMAGPYKLDMWGNRSNSPDVYGRVLFSNTNGTANHYFYTYTPNYDHWVSNFTATGTSSSIQLYGYGTGGTGVYGARFDDISVKPVSLYLYRSAGNFTNTGQAGVTLLTTLNGTDTTYTDNLGGAGTYWYVLTATTNAIDVTAAQGTAVPEPATLTLLAGAGLFGLRRRN